MRVERKKTCYLVSILAMESLDCCKSPPTSDPCFEALIVIDEALTTNREYWWLGPGFLIVDYLILVAHVLE